MGLLAPLYLLGLAALSFPVLFHLIRRTPRGRQVFSSLMFLSPTPPRLTRRSRLDQILLLLMRLAALGLLVFAFTRPFLRESALLSVNDLPRRRVAILLDASASMRRGDLWTQAISRVEEELKQLAPHDDVALFVFSDKLQTVVPFETDPAVDRSAAGDVIRSRLKELEPTWQSGNLGTALTTVAGELDASSDVQQSLSEPQIVLVSDLQKGSRIDALQAFEWPTRVRVIPGLVADKKPTNATLQLIVGQPGEEETETRVKVTSAAGSTNDQFFVRWSGAGELKPGQDEVAVYLPLGESRVVKLPRPEGRAAADRVVLRGDDHEFDNVYYVVPPQKQEVRMRYLGPDKGDDAQGLLYYLEIALADDPLRDARWVTSEAVSKVATSPAPQLTFLTGKITADQAVPLREEVERGGTVVLVPQVDDAAETIAAFLDDVEIAKPSPEVRSMQDFLLLGEIDFSHPLFASFANPRYSDFTKIHFWRRRPVTLKAGATTRVFARFDDGSPWALERPLGRGRVIALTSGWSPDDSQLAVSTKFVTLIGNLVDQACGTARPLAGVLVGEPVTLPAERSSPLVLRQPDGKDVTLAPGEQQFGATSLPGLYRAVGGTERLQFAVNVAPRESETAPLPVEALEQLGVRLGTSAAKTERLGRIRQQRDVELESRQKVWRWLIVACLALVIAETWYSGRSAGAADSGPVPGGSDGALKEAVT